MSPDDFIANSQGFTLNERASAQEHLIDIGRAANALTEGPARASAMLGKTPADAGGIGGCSSIRGGEAGAMDP